MKSFWKIFLAVYLTLITAAAGVFGYFFFAGKDYYDFNGEDGRENSQITIEKASEIVTTACNELGWLKNSGASIQSAEYVDYNEELKLGDEISENFFKQNVVTAKYMLDAMEESNISPNKYYYDQQQLPNSSYTVEMMGYVNLNGNKAEIHVYDATYNAEIVLVVTGDLEYGKSWSIEYFSNRIGTHSYAFGGMGYGIIAANEAGVYQFAYSSLSFRSSSTEISRDNLMFFDIYDCDTYMNRLLDVSLEDLTDEEIASYGMATVNNVNRVTFLNWENVKIEKQINFLNEYWTAMGIK